MDWMSTLATAIAVLRLGLICGGMWLLLRTTARPLDFHKKCFAVSGIVYLLGLLPQSLLLLLLHSDLVSLLLDSGHLCGAQNLACGVAVALHSTLFLCWIAERGANAAASRRWRPAIAAYVVVILCARGFFLRREDGSRFYADIAARTNVTQWTTAPVEHPTQVVKLQLLLCECSIDEEEVWNFLMASYAFLFLPIVMLCWALRSYLRKIRSRLGKDLEQEEEKVGDQLVWWEREDNIQHLLSTTVTVWFYFIQPIIFALHQQHFVDFGTHLLMTICVFIPWTLAEKEHNEQSWV